MKDYRRRVLAGTVNFRRLVQDCAAEPQLVESFNRACGARLQAPITALSEDRWPEHLSADEEIQIGYFIVFVHRHVWLRLQRARTLLGAEWRSIVE